MKTLSFLLILSTLVGTQAVAADNNHKQAKQLYKANCASCHGVAGGMDMSKRVAPPIVGVRMHYISTYADKDSFVMAVADWVESPDASNSLMRGAVQKFKLMPKVAISRKDVEKIAAYIYDGNIEKPEGFQKHYEMRHGNK